MSIYNDIYDIIVQFIYGGTVNEFSDLTATLLATIGCVFVFSVPFMVVWKVIKLIMG